MNQTLAVITYDHPHRKTQDVISRLLIQGTSPLNITLIILPWVERQNFSPLYPHRPHQAIDKSPRWTADHLGMSYHYLTDPSAEAICEALKATNADHILLAGAGRIPEQVTQQFKIINSHPAYLPDCAGLDAVKWAIFKSHPLGVTLHYIDGKLDSGILIERTMVPLYFEDSYHSLCQRVYEKEIQMLAEAPEYVEKMEKPGITIESLAESIHTPGRRMPHHLEVLMMERFHRRRQSSHSMHQF